MIFFLYSELSDSSINTSLGRPQYSYYFLFKSFRPLFESLGDVVVIDDPLTDVDPLFDKHSAAGKSCLFISFTPPHLTATSLRCPTTSLFAWEFSSIPTKSWDKNPANSWTHVFSHHQGVIATSSHTAKVVTRALESQGVSCPVLGIPTPLWDDFSDLRSKDSLQHLHKGSQLTVSGNIQDTGCIEFDLNNLLPRHFQQEQLFQLNAGEPELIPDIHKKSLAERLGNAKLNWRRFLSEILPSRENLTSENSKSSPRQVTDSAAAPSKQLQLRDVVYTTILNPEDGRKCHLDLMTAFVSAFKDQPLATLIMKMTQSDADSYRFAINHTLHQLYPYQCRIIVFNGFLETEKYNSLIDSSTYYINTSHCEGLCIPLMEFLCSGKPVIAPLHTAMEDYIDNDLAFVIETNIETNVWPHDPRGHYTTERHRNNWESIVEQLQLSYQIAQDDQPRYREMSDNAKRKMKDFCSFEVVKSRMQKFIDTIDFGNGGPR